MTMEQKNTQNLQSFAYRKCNLKTNFFNSNKTVSWNHSPQLSPLFMRQNFQSSFFNSRYLPTTFLPVCPDQAKYRHVGKNLCLWHFSEVHLVFVEIVNQVWLQKIMIFSKSSGLSRAKYWNNNLAIWSHWFKTRKSSFIILWPEEYHFENCWKAIYYDT